MAFKLPRHLEGQFSAPLQSRCTTSTAYGATPTAYRPQQGPVSNNSDPASSTWELNWQWSASMALGLVPSL
eukprot:15455566-Alexandrium_andersonii.AAC.1